MRAADTTACPCQSGRPYSGCCAPLHRQDAMAENAEALMRSRYSAYVLAESAYLLATWHASTRPSGFDGHDALSTRWLGLEVKRHVVHDPEHATVEFVARYRTGGNPAVRLHEVSRFVREAGRWYYLDGEFPAR
ncbi:YchJ family protein [Lysobacter niabensis]|uniref:YchJ family protein n=1 Tax=Agrilutibacter niabensis TaxID=380628 RepID=UPI00360A0ABB